MGQSIDFCLRRDSHRRETGEDLEDRLQSGKDQTNRTRFRTMTAEIRVQRSTILSKESLAKIYQETVNQYAG